MLIWAKKAVKTSAKCEKAKKNKKKPKKFIENSTNLSKSIDKVDFPLYKEYE